MPRYPVTMEVKEIREELPPMCPVHKVGDKIVIDNGRESIIRFDRIVP